MFQVLKELLKDEIQQDVLDGEKRGEERGIMLGRAEGSLETAKLAALNIRDDLNITDPARIARLVNVETELVERWLSE